LRTLVISDTHFGAWTGRDLLREEFFRERGDEEAGRPLPGAAHFDAVVREEAARQAREQPLPGPAPLRPQYPEPTVLSRSSPTEHALEAFSQVVANLRWDREADRPGLPKAPA